MSASLRDAFTAGGRRTVPGLGEMRQVDVLLLDVARELVARLSEFDEEVLMHYWRVPSVDTYRIEQWLGMAEGSPGSPQT